MGPIHELADEGAFTSVVVLTASFPSGFLQGLDLNPRPSLQEKLAECNEINHLSTLAAKPEVGSHEFSSSKEVGRYADT